MGAYRELTLDIDTPRWSLPVLPVSEGGDLVLPEGVELRSIGLKGGRSSGKSHWFAERLVERMVSNPHLQWVCVREIQKSLKFSAKKLVEDKIRKLKVGHLFDIHREEIRRKGGTGILIFQGMQDHNSDSIKSLEGFDGAWVEEAQSLSARSLELLDPTIRKDGSQIWYSWNSDQPGDAVEKLFASLTLEDGAVCVHVNYTQNPWCPKQVKLQAARMKKKDYEKYVHIWLGGYNTRSEAQIFGGYWRVDEFEPDPQTWDGPYQGLDFGFSEDPTCGVRCWIFDNRLYIEYDNGKTSLDLDHTAGYFEKRIPGFNKQETHADSARPESISFLKRHGMAKLRGVKKWNGSVQDGIEFLKTFDEIIIHMRCKYMQEEARLYSFKTNKAGEVTDVVLDSDNHRWDAVRYALSRLIKRNHKTAGVW